jgi:alkyl hydroperoxide reductase subunit AhpC
MIELGQLEGKAAEFQIKHVRVIAVSLDNLADSKATQAKFPHLLVVADFEKKLSQAVQVIQGSEGHNAPTTILVDGKGVVRWVFRPESFLIRLSPEELLRAVDQHMGGAERRATRSRSEHNG